MQQAEATRALHAAANAEGPLPPEAIEFMLANLHKMPVEEKLALLAELETLERKQLIKRARTDFLAFCALVYPEFKEGPHHRHLRPLLHEIKEGTQLRLTVSMAPRFGKSISIAFLFVAWYLGHHPTHHIMMITHTASLSAAFGRDVRNLIGTPVYREVFPDTVVSTDKSAADNWTTTLGGKYLAIGIGANVAGHGAHLLVADDLVSEQSVLTGNPDAAFTTAWEYMQVGPLQRLMPGGRIVMIGTRWGKRDPIGRALAWAEDNPDSIPWHEVRFPAILPSGKSLWPEQWPVDQLLAKKAGMQPQFWAAQYMQEPTSEEGALLKREWWKIWHPEKPPKVDFIIQTWDTAHETKTTNDYSACSTWGVWFDESDGRNKLMLLNAFQIRLEFPQLKKRVLEEYREWQPECLLIEKKAAGAPLIQELRQMDIVVQEYSPSRGSVAVSNDKRARVNAVSDILFSGLVYAPDTRWAHELINQCAEFPNGESDDLVDTTVMSWARFRKGGFISLDSDARDDETPELRRRKAYY
jgi:predicted phage terminase large subunit-like protein